MDTKRARAEVKDVNSDKGEVTVAFATFNVKDSDWDVTSPAAFEEGAQALISPFGHKVWDGALPTGIGTLSSTNTEALFTGQYFMDTQAGADNFRVVSKTKDAMEWSYGYDAVEYSFGEHEGEHVRFLNKLKVHEVSPVILGAGVGTRTLSAKSGRASGAEKCVRCGHQFTKGEYYANAPTEDTDVSIVVCPGCVGMKFADEVTAVLASVKALSDRAADVLAKRQEKGKGFGADTSALLGRVAAEMKRLDDLLKSPAPVESNEDATREYLRIVARRLG